VHGVSQITPVDVGARVSVRRRVERALSDIVGDLESLDDEILAVRTSAGSVVKVSRADVVAARVVGASPRGAVEIEGFAARGWPAPDSQWLGQWWLRCADGFTARANSVRPRGTPGVPLAAALDHVAAWYGARGLPARVQVVVGSSLDRELAQRGWTAAPEVSVMTATLAMVASRLPESGAPSSNAPNTAAPNITVASAASSDWLALFRGGDTPPVARAILDGPPVVGFATLLDDAGATVAIGRAAVETPWVGFTAIEVEPGMRRHGYGRAVMAQLTSWSRDRGALRAYLEVLATNEPAVALYASLGFTEHHRYACREAPSL
jgi:GNAT superfamily N-acetyltransferase